MNSLVSIVIPVYNGENFLSEAINSALSQTYSHIEVLVINDGSTDKTEDIALSYGDKIRYYSKENGGVSTALNLGISKMHGDYFSWLSHDDLYLPEKIAEAISAIETSCNSSTDIVYSDYTIIDKSGDTIAVTDIRHKYPDADLTFGMFPLLKQMLNGCSMLIHKSHFIRVGVFDETLRATQDYDLWFKMCQGVTFVYLNKPLVAMREHGAQVTHSYERNRVESDELWLKMLKHITREDTIRLGKTENYFWNNQIDFLSYTPYKDASAYAKSKLKEVGGTRIYTASSILRLVVYKILSTISRLMRCFGIQKTLRESRLFRLGYKMWFGVRYK